MRKNFVILTLSLLLMFAFTAVVAQEVEVKPAEQPKAKDVDQKTYEFKQPISKDMMFEKSTTYKIAVKTMSSFGENPGQSKNDGGTMSQTAKYTFLEVEKGELQKFKIEFTKLSLKSIAGSTSDDSADELLKLKGEWIIAIKKKGKFVPEKYSEKLDKLIKEEQKKAKELRDNYGPEEDWEDWDDAETDLYQEDDMLPPDEDEEDFYGGQISSYIRQILNQPAIQSIAPKKPVAVNDVWNIKPEMFGNLFDSPTFGVEDEDFKLKLVKIEKVGEEEIAHITLERSYSMEEENQKTSMSSTGTIKFNVTTNSIMQVKLVFKMSSKYEDEHFGSFSNDITVDSTEDYKYLASEKVDEEPEQPKGEE